MIKIMAIVGISIIALTVSSAFAQTSLHTPRAGTAERKSIMDAARVPIESKLKKKVVFKVDRLKVENGFAFLMAVPQTPEGRLAYDGTEYERARKAGFASDIVCVLLRLYHDKWRVLDFAIGPTDVVYEDWDKKYDAPSSIFK